MNKTYSQKISIIALTFLLAITSCKDDPLNIGINILPEADLLEFRVDTLQLDCRTIKGINIEMPFDRINRNTTVGAVEDPVFGKTNAELIFNFNPTETAYGPSDSTKTNILVGCNLYLKTELSDKFGNDNTFQHDIFPLNRRIEEITTSYIKPSEDFDYNNNLSDSGLFSIDSFSEDVDSDSVFLDKTGLTEGAFLIFGLSESYAESFLTSSSLNDESNFNQEFPGLYLRPYISIDEDGALYVFSPSNSKIVLEFKEYYPDNDSTSESIYLSFDVDYYQSLYHHDYNESPIYQFLDDEEDSVQPSEFFIQSLGGVGGKISIPDFDKFVEENKNKIAVNMAEVVFPISTKSNFIDLNDYYNPDQLIIEIDTSIFDERRNFIHDAVSYSYFGGNYNSDNLDYRLNLTEFIQKKLTEEINYDELYLRAGNFDFRTSIQYTNPGRVVLNSGSSSNSNPAFLRIIYTLIE